MKLVHVVPDVSMEAAGPSYAVPRLCASLAARGHDVELSCLAAAGDVPGVRVDLHPRWPVAGRFEISTSLARALRAKAGCADVVHNHSLWSMVNVAAGWVVPGRHARLVTSPHGTLAPWALARRRALKRVLWHWQQRALERADLLHATSDVERDDIRDAGCSAPVAVIPNGVDVPALPAKAVLASPPGVRTLLFLGRVHPVKGVDRLLRAWRDVQDRHPDWRLRVVGPGRAAHLRAMRELAASLAVARVEFPGPVYGAGKSGNYFASDLFVLPSHTENFGMAVAEALAHGVPAVVGRGAPWAGLEREDCGWWVGNDVPSLAAALDAAMSVPAARRALMGRNGRAWMERDYGWDAIARRMEAAYLWVVGRGARPDDVTDS